MPKKVLTSMADRLAAAAQEVVERRAALQLAQKQRDELVREAVDSGELSQRAVAAAAGVTGPRVSAILADPGDDDE